MAFEKEIIEKIDKYCMRDLPDNDWYNNEFNFIKDKELKERIITEFKNARYIYKFFEGISAENELRLAEVRLQILMYASIYEAIIHYVLFDEYYKESDNVKALLTQKVTKKISISEEQRAKLGKELEHDGKDIIPYYMTTQKRDITKIRFDEKCKAAFDIGFLEEIIEQRTTPSPIVNSADCDGMVTFCAELIKIYEIRNAIHLHAELKKDIAYHIEMSKVAYYRMQPFIAQIKKKLEIDGLFVG